MGDGGSRHEVERAGSDRGGAGHNPPAAHRLRIGGGCMCHRLLVMRPVGGQHITHAMQRLTHAGDVAVAEDRPDTAKEGLDVSVARFGLDDRFLGGHRADQSLRHGQPDFAHPEHPTFLLLYA